MTEEPPITGSPVPPAPPAETPLSDEEVLKRADEIQKAREAAHQEELRKAEELKRAEEVKKAEAIAEAERIKRLEDEKKAEELRRAQELVKADEAKKAEEARKAEEIKEQARREAEKEAAKKASAEAPKKKHTGLKIFGIIILLLAILGVVVVISSSVTITPLGADGSYSYATGYNVWLPLNQEFNVGGYKVIALSTADSMMVSLGGVTYPLAVGEVISVPDQMGTLSIFWGNVQLISVKYEVALTYLGVAENGQAAFKMVIASDKQLPETLIKLFLSMSGVTVASA
ncbi:MAG: hypothetical protein Q4Q04_01860 [Methanocorpusculum sp.]|nr:hypothetical protein [Methanocorpusculum sp.]